MTIEDPRIYIRVSLYVRGLIADGVLGSGDPAPTITALCRRFGCTRQTVAHALRLLADEDVLTRYPGLGYYVSHCPNSNDTGDARRRDDDTLPGDR